MLKDTHSAWHFWFMINFFWRVLCWSHCLCSFPSHAWSHHLTPNFCVRKSFSVIAVLNLCIVSITFAHFLLGLEMLCSHGVPPPPQSSLWNTSQMLSPPGIALAITYWWPSLWTSTPRCPTGVSDSAYPKGPHPASSVPKSPPCGSVGPTSWSYSFPCVLQVPTLLTWTATLVSPLVLCSQSCFFCCVHGPVHMTSYSCLKPPKDSAISWFRQIHHNYMYLSKLTELNKGWVYSM